MQAISQANAPTELRRWQLLEQLTTLLADCDPNSDFLYQALTLLAELVGARGTSLQSEGLFGSLQVELSAETTLPVQQRKQQYLQFSLDNNRGELCIWRGGKPWSDEECLPLQVAVGMLSNALTTAEKLNEERSERVLAESLRQVAQVLNSSLDMEEVLARILDQLRQLIPYDSANVMLLEDGELRMHAARGYQEFSGPVDMSGIRFVPEHTALMMDVLTGGKPVIQADTTLLSDWLWVPCGKHIRSWMGVPLRAKDQAIGLFSIDKSIPGFFTSKHAEMAMALAAHAALALDNARMFAQIREAQEQLRGLSTQIMEAQEQERGKIAVELHDHAGQALLGLRAELQALKRSLSPESNVALKQIENLDGIIVELSCDLRQLAHDLHPPMLTELGLIPALEQHVDEFSRRLNIPAKLEVDQAGNSTRLPQAIELVCYRVVQEALTNLAKYAQAKTVKISLVITPSHIRLSVIDDGVGFSRHSRNRSRNKGFGLLGMRERVIAVGGELQIWSQAGQGTRLEVEIPLAPLDKAGGNEC